MKLLTIILVFFLYGCGFTRTPLASSFWIKNGHTITSNDYKVCENNIKMEMSEYERKRYEYLYDLWDKDPINMIENHRDEHKEYKDILLKQIKLNDKCFYDLGYRFNAPITWCLIQNGDNTSVCIRNQKYRY